VAHKLRSEGSQFEASPGKQFARPYLGKKKEKKSQKRAGGVAHGVDPEFKLQHYTHTHTHKKKTN
jgi:hypothetical protein